MSGLLTDFYELTMLQAYLEEDLQDEAVFELFVRRLPPQRNFLVAAGLAQVLDWLEALAFDEAELAWLAHQGGLTPRALDYLRHFRFGGDVHALPEGTLFFADEPVLRITAALPQAQLVESRLMNLLHYQTLIASKAARAVLVAGGRHLVDFGMRRAHGAEAALLAARACWIAGFDGTATAEAARRFGIPVVGTMAHSFVQAHASEAAAFEAFARARPQRPTLLIDTYDTDAAVDLVIGLARRLEPEAIALGGVRLDSGDLAAQARRVRARLDEAGLPGISILASGNLDEQRIAQLIAAGAPIDGFGLGTALDTSSDAPSLDTVYKLQSYAGVARRKRSVGKATWPGVRQLVRRWNDDGTLRDDLVTLDGEPAEGEALLQPCMWRGRRVGPQPTLAQIRAHHATQMQSLPPTLRTLEAAPQPYPVDVSAGLRALAREVDARDARQAAQARSSMVSASSLRETP